MIVRCLIAVLFAGSVCLAADQIPGIGPADEVKQLHTGFEFTEGPAADAAGNLYFTDIPNQRIHKLDSQNQLSVFAENSGYCNGLMVVGERLLACEMNGKLKEYRLADASQTTLAEQFEGNRFNAPNDLVIDRTGGIYFTDPRFRAPEKLPQGKEAVYYRAADGTVTRLIDDRKAPNGIILSPDESLLYVIPSLEKQMWVYPVEAPGKIGAGKILCELQQRPGQDNGGGDGLTIDTQGNLYITSALGIQVVSPDGKILGIIAVPEQPANVTFGGPDHRTLFITARKSLYAVPMESTGHVFSGPTVQ